MAAIISRTMRKRRSSHWIFLLLLLVAGVGAVRAWFYIDEQVQPILKPVNQAYEGYSNLPQTVPGLKLEPFIFTGWDGVPVQAVIVTREGEESSRQLTVMSDLNANPVENIGSIDYLLISVDWDHGIRSALPLAESFTAAGIRCVLWDSRGVDDRRLYCTHGLKESKDVPLLLDALTQRSGKVAPSFVGVGQGYGASLLLRATAHESRIRGLISIDAYASLRQSVRRLMPDSFLTPIIMECMDVRIDRMVGMACFDVAPVEQASWIERNVPVLVVNLALDNPVSTPLDALTIYSCLRSDRREVWSISAPLEERHLPKRLRTQLPEMRHLPDEDSVIIAMVHWLDGPVVEAILSPRIADPARPIPSSDLHL